MKKTIIKVQIILIAFFSLSTGCTKFLDERPDIKLVVPELAEDLQALLDNERMNKTVTFQLFCTDEVYVDDNGFNSAGTTYLSFLQRNFYTWENNPYEPGEASNDWNLCYQKIFYANTVLEQVEKLNPASQADIDEVNSIKGTALFYRAFSYYELLQLFAPFYEPGTSGGQPAVPLRLTQNVLDVLPRSNLKDCYDQVFSDLNMAYDLLPARSTLQSRPSKLSTDALLARIYLSIADYNKALVHANKALSVQASLMDYNEIDGTQTYVFPVFNEEIILHNEILSFTALSGWNSPVYINPDLYNLYDSNDLRKSLYYLDRSSTRRFPAPGMHAFTGYYSGGYLIFTGLATDELYLTKAECLARAGQVTEALQSLNSMLETRWRTGTFEPYTTNNSEEALAIILEERCKQLVKRGTIRWTDLRRLNKESRFAKTLVREVAGNTYTLPPNDLRYTLLIPPNEIELSGIEQNPRN